MKNKQIRLIGKPQPKQREFFCAKSKYIAYGGARGGGKSWALRRKLILMCLKYAGISTLIVRKSFPELRENHIRPLLLELTDIAKYSESKKSFEFPNGSRIKLGYCDSDEDVNQYQGQEYDVIALDEATQFTEYQFQAMKGTLRGANNFPKRMYITCNPGGVGHAWVKRLFIDRDFREGENANDYKFIPARVFDNEVLLKKNPDYLGQLKSLPASLKDAWLNGSWEAFAGQYFPEFDYSVHVCEPFLLDEGFKKYCAIDYGLDMLAAVFVAIDKDGNAYVYDEINIPNLIVSMAAQEILKKSQGVCEIFAPSDLWSRQKDSGKSIYELFYENGVYLTKISTGRVQGWLCLKEWLKPQEIDGKKCARMKFFKNCTFLIRYIPLLMHDKDTAADVSTRPHDITHLPDALRYFAVTRPAKFLQKEKDKSRKLTDKLIYTHKRCP